MAEAATVSATIKVALGTVISLATDRAGLVLGFEKELEGLTQSAIMIRGFLADADEKMQTTAVQEWLKQLEREVFKAEYVLDELNYENLRREVKYRNQLKKKVCFFFSYFNTLGLRSNLASKIRDINTNLHSINQQARDLGLAIRDQTHAAIPPAAEATTSRKTDSIVVPNVVGRADDESKIVDTLLDPSEKAISVIPIIGMGGLGKTTLAKSVHNNPKIIGHFDKRIWVCVAEKIQTTELFKLILVQLTKKEVKVNDRNVIVMEIGEKLRGQRYFLVLDDVWNDEQELWNDFFTTMEGLNATKGNWCLVTTRLESVANAVSRPLKMNDGPYFLGKLSDDECWSILKGKVLVGEEVPTELEALRKQILRKCDGLPLAAKLIGGLLINNEKEKWQSIVQDSIYGNEIQQILKVSFNHLSPPPLKKCFAYCSIFPQDTELEEDELIEHWIAEGFVLPDSGNKRVMEEIGGEYLKILLQNSLLDKAEWGTSYYKMHDLVHDFAKSVLNPESSNGDGRRYLALNSSEGMAQDMISKSPASPRTLFLHLGSGISTDLLSRFKYLHVLKLSGHCVECLPSSIGKLIHLRLLDTSSSDIRSLPNSLCKLYYLQTLTMRNLPLIEGFPKRMSNLVNLRHLNYYEYEESFKMPMHMGRLTCLQTLEFFNVSKEKGCGIEELGTLKYLKGSLEIRNLELVNGKEAARKAKLLEKSNLSSLVFEWTIENRKSDNSDEDVLEGLQPHQNLQKLEIRGFMGNSFPQWFMNLSTLVELEIANCERCRELRGLGQFLSLEVLELNKCMNLTDLPGDLFRLSLKRLRIYGCPRLISLGVNGQRSPLPCLEYCRIMFCCGLTIISGEMFESCTSLRVLQVVGCPNLVSFSLNLQETPSLEEFALINCPKLITNRPRGFAYAINLKNLDIDPFLNDLSNVLDWSDFMSAPPLRRLKLHGMRNKECVLPHQLQYLIALTFLSLDSFGTREALPDWIGNLVSLEELSLTNCEKLQFLPSETTMRRLTKLTSLQVYNCPLFKHRYNPQRGIYSVYETEI